MVYKFEKHKTGSTPYVLVDEEKGFMRFEGESYHESIINFFKEVNEWLKDYLKTNFGSFTFECELEYFNSSTAKLLHNMLLDMNEHTSDDNKVVVNWMTTEDNDIIIECGEDFKEEMDNLEFNMVINIEAQTSL